MTHQLTTDYRRSLQEAEAAIKWADASHLRRHQALARGTKAKALRLLGHISEMEAEFETAIRLLRHSSDLSTLGQIENDYGYFLSNTGRKRRAKALYEQAYEHYTKANNFYRTQIATNNLAYINKVLGLFQPALVVYQQLFSEGLAQGDKSPAACGCRAFLFQDRCNNATWVGYDRDMEQIRDGVYQCRDGHETVIRDGLLDLGRGILAEPLPNFVKRGQCPMCWVLWVIRQWPVKWIGP